MIRTLQKKFIITAMTAVTVLLLVVLGVLNVVNAFSNTRQSEALLDELAMRSVSLSFSGGPREENGQNFGTQDRPAETGGPAFGSPPPEGEGSGGPGFAGDPGSAPADQPGSQPGQEPFSGENGRRRRGFLDDPMDENTQLSAVYFTVELDERCAVKSVDVSHIATVSEEEASAMALNLDVDQEAGTVEDYRYKIFSTPEGGYRVVFLDSATRHRSVLRVLLLSVLLGGLSWLLMLGLVVLLSKKAIRPIAENMERQRQFVTDAGHELKTPLAIILANVDAMELRGGESKYSRNIRAQAQRLSELTKNLLTLARMDETALQQNAETFDFSDLCTESFGMFREAAELKRITFETDIISGIAYHGDRAQLAQLCSILGDNAVKYCPEDGAIAVHLAEEGRNIQLTVSNSVQEAPDTDRMFDRFYRSDSSRNQKSGGFGIGLSAAQSIVQLHRGSITADYDEESKQLHLRVKLHR